MTIQRWRRALLCAAGVTLVWFTAGCTPDPTPYPVVLPSETPPPAPVSDSGGTPVPAGGAPVRYGLAGNVDADDVFSLPMNATVEVLTDVPDASLLGARYDVLVAYGVLPGWLPAPGSVTVLALGFGTRAPMDEAAVQSIVQRAFNPQAAVGNIAGAIPFSPPFSDPRALRAELANAGYPDGFALRVRAGNRPGEDALIQQLRALGVTVTVLHGAQAFADVWLTVPPQGGDSAAFAAQAGAAFSVALYTLPVSYLAAEGVAVTFDPASPFPQAAR